MRSFLLLPIMALLVACSSNDGAGVKETPDGSKINLSVGPKGWVTVDTTNGTMTGYNQDHSFYGAWYDNSNQVKELSYQATEATNIPQSGTATYYGHAVRVEDGEAKLVGTSRLNVDFGNKTVDGQLSMDGVRRDVTLHEGSLNGAKFSGQASVLGNSGGVYSGGLAGDGATEAVGLVRFSNNSDLNTAFGGKRFQ